MSLRFHDVSFAYPGKKPTILSASFEMEQCDFLLIRGPSGAGKSTFLRLVNRLLEPTDGTISFCGRLLVEYDPTVLRRRVCYIHQVPVTIRGSVRDNLTLPFSFASSKEDAPPDDDVLRHHLDDLLLKDVDLDHNARELSVGQMQRICLLRAILMRPEILLLDEPTSALDARSAAVVDQWIERLNREQGIGVVKVSHIESAGGHALQRSYHLEEGTFREAC